MKLRSAGQDFDEGSAKFDVECSVNDGVEGAVDVAEPGEGAVQLRRHVALTAVSVQDMSHKEGQPADEKDS